MSESLFEKAYLREKASRVAAERLLEEKTRDLYVTNKLLATRNSEMEEKHQQLVQAEKMASIGTLSAGIAHEINNPVGYSLSNLHVLREYGDLLRDTNATPEKVEMAMEDMPLLIAETIEGMERVRQITEDLRGFVRKTGSAFAIEDINQAITKTLNLLNNELKYHVNLELQLTELPDIECNVEKISQVIMNLVINASHATKSGGTISILSDRIGDMIRITVRDNGVGIPEKNIDQIFEPFFTTKEPGKGTGLGLYISYGIAKEHGGDLFVESTPGEGTVFELVLPIVPSERNDDERLAAKDRNRVSELNSVTSAVTNL